MKWTIQNIDIRDNGMIYHFSKYALGTTDTSNENLDYPIRVHLQNLTSRPPVIFIFQE